MISSPTPPRTEHPSRHRRRSDARSTALLGSTLIGLVLLTAALPTGCGESADAVSASDCPANAEAARDALRGRTAADGPVTLCPGVVYDGPLHVPPGVTLIGQGALVRTAGEVGVRLDAVARAEDLQILVDAGARRGVGLLLAGEGAVAEDVAIALAGPDAVGVAITASAGRLADVRVAGASSGEPGGSPSGQVGLWLVESHGAGELTVQTLSVEGLGGLGVVAEGGTRLVAEDLTVASIEGVGLWFRGGTASLADVTVRGIQAPGSASLPRTAHGILVTDGATLSARNAVLMETGGSALVVVDASATLERSGILATGGPGVIARGEEGADARLALSDVVVREVRGAAIDAEDVRVALEGLFLDQVSALAVAVDELRVEPMADALQLRSGAIDVLRDITAVGFGRLGLGIPEASRESIQNATLCAQRSAGPTRWTCVDEPDASVCATTEAPAANEPWACRYEGDRLACSAPIPDRDGDVPVLLPDEAPLAEPCFNALQSLLGRTATGLAETPVGWAAIIGEDGTLGQRPAPLNAGAIQQREALAWQCTDDATTRTCTLAFTGLRLAARDTPAGWSGGAWRCAMEAGERICRDESVALLEGGTIATPAEPLTIDGSALRARTELRSGERLALPRFPLTLPELAPANLP